MSLYNLLEDADTRYARAMVILVAVGATFEFANVLNLIAPLILLSGAGFLSLIVACFAYVAASFAYIVLATPPHLFYHLMQALGGVAEGAMTIWLLVKGVKVPVPEPLPSHAT